MSRTAATSRPSLSSTGSWLHSPPSEVNRWSSPCADWVRRPHTIALLSWQGQWWCRDEYFGVFTLDRPVEAKPDMKQLVLRAETMLEKHVKTVMRTAVAASRSAPPTSMSSEQRLREVAVVARTVPFSTTIFWVKCGSRELPVAFFRPTAQQIAVYDPLHSSVFHVSSQSVP